MLGRAELVAAVNRDGLQLQWPTGLSQTVSPTVIEHLTELKNPAAFNLILVTVKSFDTTAAVAGLVGRLSTGAQVLSLQNGVGNEEALAAMFPGQAILAGSITLPVAVPQVGTIVVSKDKGGIGLALAAGATELGPVAQALRQAGFTVSLYHDYRSLKWSKLLMNIISNAIPAILDLPPGEALAYPEIFALELDAIKEALAVMRAQQIRVVSVPGYPVPLLAVALRLLPKVLLQKILRPMMVGGRGDKLPSLQIDMRKGRNQSEINVLNKVVADAGKRVGVATPINETLSDILNGINEGSIPRARYLGAPGALIAAVQAKQHMQC